MVSDNTSRRTFCALAAAALPSLSLAQVSPHFNVADFDRTRTLAAANQALERKPAALGEKDYRSDDPTYFPDEDNARGPYVRREGYTNPAAFTAHRDALVQLNAQVSALTAAWRITAELRFATHALAHLHAWFLDPATSMNPNLELAGRLLNTPYGTWRGVEETTCIAGIVRAASFLCAPNAPATDAEATGLRTWFNTFATWLNESKKGGLARDAKDRLAICWTMQAAECARFARNEALLLQCSHRFRDKLLRQMNFDGAFPLEVHRADSFAASIFTLDCLSLACESLSTPFDRLWDFTLADGRGMRSAVAYLYPALNNRARWAFPADVQHFSGQPARQPSLLLAGRAYGRTEYIETWQRLPAEPRTPDMLRYFPVREPALWTTRVPA